MLGVVNLDKPVGPTSHDMVAMTRRLTGTRRIGHAGTLDPLASGVLPILVGAATRFSEELTGGPKRYDAVIRLGARSVTDDGEGPIEPSGRPIPDEGAIRAALEAFVGTFDQRPPRFSARKVGGRTAHRAARAGEPIDVPARSVTVHSLHLTASHRHDGLVDLMVDLRCGAGTYVRAIARDVGERLGCGGYLATLRRTEAAGLRVEAAISPERLEMLAAEGRIGTAVLPVANLLRLPRLVLDSTSAAAFRNGSPRSVAGAPPEDGRAAVFEGEELLGIGSVRASVLQPEKVLPRDGAG